jgi:hypothetical protein
MAYAWPRFTIQGNSHKYVIYSWVLLMIALEEFNSQQLCFFENYKVFSWIRCSTYSENQSYIDSSLASTVVLYCTMSCTALICPSLTCSVLFSCSVLSFLLPVLSCPGSFLRCPALYCYFLPCAEIFKQSMGARNRVGIGLSYWFLGIDSWAP